jgi:hypothetical protein
MSEQKIYFNVPNDGALTRAQAIKIAKGRNWSWHTHEGIVYQGSFGQEHYIENDEFTESERRFLAKHFS